MQVINPPVMIDLLLELQKEVREVGDASGQEQNHPGPR
jgi:hypothetical protein